MRIAQVSPLFESVPPRRYGGTERVIAYLTEELVRRGHEVTLFASGDSTARARLMAPCPRALWREEERREDLPHHLVEMEALARSARSFDVIHFHTGYLHFPLARRLDRPHLTTLHGSLEIPDLVPLFREYREMPVVSISDAQRDPLPWLNWQGTVHHGLPRDLHALRDGSGGYLAFLGRIAPEKGVAQAIRIARLADRELKIAARVDSSERPYFEEVVEPCLDDPRIQFVGEIGEREKGSFLGGAAALLFPIEWSEPFGLVMIEALACGTPVVTFRRGSVPEVIEDGVTGFVVDGPEEAAVAVERLEEIDRRRCRRSFEERFTAERMAGDYLALFRDLARGRPTSRSPAIPPAAAPAADR